MQAIPQLNLVILLNHLVIPKRDYSNPFIHWIIPQLDYVTELNVSLALKIISILDIKFNNLLPFIFGFHFDSLHHTFHRFTIIYFPLFNFVFN